ncbi:MAG: S-layer homology domain-containing protein, partial [Clostridiales bacterium]|nr:S-layer homology domain-containing protein [Clostridiales bacterium]
NAPPGTSYGDDGRITIPAGSDGATLTLPDGSTIFVPGGYTMIPDDAQPGGYAIVFDNPFTDVSESDWFYGDVEYVFTRGLFKGTSATEFAPHMDVTRGMLITVLGRLHGVNEAEHQGASFDDVAPGAYYAAYVKWGFDNGLVLGVGENRYEPDRAIKREELAAIFSRYAAFINFEMPATREAPAFADEDEISGYAKEAIGQMYRAGIINGMGDDVIAPGAAATRAQMAAMVHRFALLVGLLD